MNENLRARNQAVQTTATEANRSAINSNLKLHGFIFLICIHPTNTCCLLDAIHCSRSRIPQGTEQFLLGIFIPVLVELTCKCQHINI